MATRHDLDDPSTVGAVVAAIGSVEVLDLVAALTEADATAAGALAWSPFERASWATSWCAPERHWVGHVAAAVGVGTVAGAAGCNGLARRAHRAG